MLRSFRAALLAIALAFVTACGGGGDSLSPDPLPGAVTLTIVAGDGQTGVPGTVLPIRPAVRAADGQGRPVASLAVRFAVDSGGGSIAAAEVQTGTDGVATAGEWTLGATETANVLRVSAEGAAPVRVRALAATPAEELVTGVSVPAGGGVITVARPGSPFDGTRVDVPAGAFSGATSWRLAARPSARLSLPPGFTQLGGALQIENGGAVADSLVRITLPVPVGPSVAVAAFARDEVTGRVELLPPTVRTATTLQVVTRHVAAAQLFQPSTGAVRTMLARAGSAFEGLTVYLVAMPDSLLDAPVGTGFDPALDSWEYDNEGSVVAPNGICAGWSLTAMYYFERQRAARGRLFNRFSDVPNYDDDNRLGIRWASFAQIDARWDLRAAQVARIDSIAQNMAVPAPQIHYQTIIMALRVTGSPQYLALRGTGPDGAFGHAVIAYAAGGGTIRFADPNLPGQGRSVQFSGAAFQPFNFSAKAGAAAGTVQQVRIAGASAVVPLASLEASFARVLDGTVAEGSFPPLVREWFDPLAGAAGEWTPLGDTLTTTASEVLLRTRCTLRCGRRTPAPGGDRQWTRLASAAGQAIAEDVADDARGALLPTAEGLTRVGMASYAVNADENAWGYADFRWVTVRATPVTISPRPFVRAFADSTLRVSVNAGILATTGSRYTWSWGDGSPSAALTGVTTAEHIYRQAGTYTIRLEMRAASGALLARDSVVAVITRLNPEVLVYEITRATVTAGAPAPGSGLVASQNVARANALVASWTAVQTGSARKALWHVLRPISQPGNPAPVPEGLYITDSLPGTIGGQDPLLTGGLGPALNTPRGTFDVPALGPFWSMTGTPPRAEIVARNPNTNFLCFASDLSYTVTQSLEYRVLEAELSVQGTLTLTLRNADPGCPPFPRPETGRWTVTIGFEGRRIR